jgi:hypothetical protein
MPGHYQLGDPSTLYWACALAVGWVVLAGFALAHTRRSRWPWPLRLIPWLVVAGSGVLATWALAPKVHSLRVDAEGMWEPRSALGFSLGRIPPEQPRRVRVAFDGATVLELVDGRRLKLGPRGAEVLGYVDGDCIPLFVDEGQFYEWHPTSAGGPRCSKAAAQPGLMVYARWSGDGWWYPAEVIRWRPEGIWVRFGDGAQEPCAPEQVLSFEVPEGREIQADWRGQGGYFPVEIEWGAGDQLRVRYDDGALDTVHMKQLRFQ